jgi:hypothetical protein
MSDPSVKLYNASGSAQTTTGTINAATNLLTLSNAIDFADNQGILVFGAGPAPTVGVPTPIHFAAVNATGSTTYSYALASVDNQGGISASASAAFNGYAALGTYLAGTLNVAVNQLTWTNGTGSPLATAIWRSTNGGAYVLLGCFRGTTIFDTGLPAVTFPGIPATPPGSAVSGWLATTISSGGGSLSVALNGNATTSVAGALVQHDDTAAINAATAANANQSVSFPAGTYNVRGLQIPSTIRSVAGAGNGASVIVSFAQTSDGLAAGVSAAMGNSPFSMSGMNMVAARSMAYDGFALSAGVKAVLFGNEFVGRIALHVVNCTNPIIIGNQISGWWDQGIYSDSNTEAVIQSNLVGPISGHVATIAGVNWPAGSAYPWGAGINCVGGFGYSVSSNVIIPLGGTWGISGQAEGAVIENNVIKFTGREAIVAGGNIGSNFKVHGNYCYWAPVGNGNLSCYDFGMSMSDDGVHAITAGDVSNNTFVNSGFSSIAVYGTGAPYTNVTIRGNSIIGSNQQTVHTSGIELSGSNVCGILVDTNSFQSPGANMAFAVAEVDSGFGVPHNNTVNTQLGAAGTSGLVSLSASSVYLDGFIAFTPAVVCSQATGTAVGTATGRYRAKGRKVELTMEITFSGTFTGGAFSSASLPFPAVNQPVTWLFTGREANTSGLAWVGSVIAGASTLIATNYNNSATITTGQKLSFTGWYERVGG